MKKSSDAKSKFEVFLDDGKGKPISELSESKFNARSLVDRLYKLLPFSQFLAVYMEMNLLLDSPDEKERMFIKSLMDFMNQQSQTAHSLRISKSTVKTRLYRLKKAADKKLKR